MGQCLSSSPEKRAYARGDDPTTMSLQYQRVLQLKKQEVLPARTQQVLDRHSSRGSMGSAYSVGSAAFNQMNPEEKDAYLIKRLKRQVAALENRKAFLENIRVALTQINDEEESLDSEDENDRYQDLFQKTLDTSVQRGMKKVDNFRLKKLKQYNRASLQRVKPTSKTKRKSVKTDRKSRRMSVPLVPRLVGEKTIEWNNSFASKLSLVRKFYDWDDIPLDFFIDREIDTKRIGNYKPRSLLTARLNETAALQSLIQDDVIFAGGRGGKKTKFKQPKSPKEAPPQKHKISTGSGVIEIDLSSLEEGSSSEDEEDKKISENVPV